MIIVRSAKTLRKIIQAHKNRRKTIGFVPTMGALHQGHGSLINRCRKENDFVVLSIFVNPTQFGPKEDFHRYPRPIKKDILFAKKEKVDIMFYPSKELLYPSGFLTYIEVNAISHVLCGSSRPTHFRGIATIVAKLLNIVQPDTLYLGQKDAQQVAVLRRMIKDLDFVATVRACPTVREKDGLALSSRNQSLTPEQRQEAPVLYQALKIAKSKIVSG